MVFLATPFHGSDAADHARWLVVVGGIMGKQTSNRLVEDLNRRDKELCKLVRLFAELVQKDTVRMPVFCFYETKPTQMLKRFLGSKMAKIIAYITRSTTSRLVCDPLENLDRRLTSTSSSQNSPHALKVSTGTGLTQPILT